MATLATLNDWKGRECPKASDGRVVNHRSGKFHRNAETWGTLMIGIVIVTALMFGLSETKV